MNRISGLLIGLMLLMMGELVAQPVPIIPLPVSIQPAGGVFAVDGAVGLVAPANNKQAADVVRYFSNYIEQVSGVKLLLTGGAAKKRQIRFVLTPTKGIGEEGYQLSVTTSGVVVQANDARGLFYGVQSLIQTLPAIRTNQVLQIPCMEVTDYPRFKWRGMMLDVSRHFFSPELVKEFIDLLAAYKMNVFHWHLVDGAGWRIEIKKYPLLTSQAAWRVDEGGRTWSWADVQFNADRSKATYGGFYTQQQIKAIVAYAASKHITVIPEIEMPGHSEAALAAYPQYSCTPKNTFAQAGNFSARDVQANYCAGNDSAFVFLQNILAEVLTLFLPNTFILVVMRSINRAGKYAPNASGESRWKV